MLYGETENITATTNPAEQKKARMHFTGLYWFKLSFMRRFASKYFPVELDMM